jgi:hypothetical protein
MTNSTRTDLATGCRSCDLWYGAEPQEDEFEVGIMCCHCESLAFGAYECESPEGEGNENCDHLTENPRCIICGRSPVGKNRGLAFHRPCKSCGKCHQLPADNEGQSDDRVPCCICPQYHHRYLDAQKDNGIRICCCNCDTYSSTEDRCSDCCNHRESGHRRFRPHCISCYTDVHVLHKGRRLDAKVKCYLCGNLDTFNGAYIPHRKCTHCGKETEDCVDCHFYIERNGVYIRCCPCKLNASSAANNSNELENLATNAVPV